MQHFRKFLPVPLVLTVAATAVGAAPLKSALDHNPPRYIDETMLAVTLRSTGHGGKSGYWFRVHTYLLEAKRGDALRVDWTQNGKVLASQHCPFESDGEREIHCDLDSSTNSLTATGDIVANLIYADDQDNTDYLLRALKLKVVATTFLKHKSYQVLGDDLLGGAIAWHADESNPPIKQLAPSFFFWIAKQDSGKVDSLRCSVDGKRQPDFQAHMGNNDVIEILDDSNGKEQRYYWTRIELSVYGLLHGSREQAAKVRGGTAGSLPKDMRLMADLPGLWECEVRSDGAVVRTLKFTVGNDGMIKATAPQLTKLPPSEVWVELGFPDKPYDDRVRPDAIKRGLRFGLPWPSGAVPKLPAASGLPDVRGK